MREKKSIPIYGLDERLTARQSIPGIATQLEGVRPAGLKDAPYWEPIAVANTLTNSSDVAFNHGSAQNIVALFWHNRSRVGKHGGAGSLRRLIAVFNTGVVEIIDPDLGAGFETVASYTITSSDAGDWEGSFTQLYNTGYLGVSKGGVPQADLLIEDDLILLNEFPELPAVFTFTRFSDDAYTQEQIDAGEYRGVIGESFFVRYAFRLKNGTLVKHSSPEYFFCPQMNYDYEGDSGIEARFSSFITCYFEGYEQLDQPSNFEYWKDKIAGVTVLITEPLSGVDVTLATKFTLSEKLKNALWYELGTYDFIDESDAKSQDLVKSFDISVEDIATLQTADVDDGTHHLRSHGVVDTYNSRIIVGNESVNFAPPSFNYKEGIFNKNIFVRSPYDNSHKAILFHFGDSNLYGGAPTVENVTDCTIITHTYNGNTGSYDFNAGTYYTIDTSNSTYSFRLRFSVNFYIDIDQDTIADNLDAVIPYSAYSRLGTPVPNYVIAEVTIETENGEYIRRIVDSSKVKVYTNLESGNDYNFYPIGNVISYPDNRAKSIKIYVDQDGFGNYELFDTYELTASEKANFAFTLIVFESLLLPTSGSVTTAPSSESVNDVVELAENKVKVSDVNNLLSFESDLVYIIGQSNKRITGFAVNALEVSLESFGQYPLYIFSEDSVWALEQSASADVVFGRVSPVDATLGLKSEKMLVNAGRVVYFGNDKGIYQLAGRAPERISEPVQSIHDSMVALGAIRTDNDRELLVAVNDKVYRYSIGYGRWYSSSEVIRQFITDSEALYGFNDSSVMADYQSLSSNAVAMTVELKNIHFGVPDYLKRFFYFYLRATINATSNFLFRATKEGKDFETTSNLYLYPKFRSVAEVDLLIQSENVPGQHIIEGIDTEYASRYKRKRGSI